MSEERPVGLTKDRGWEIGVRRTFPVNPMNMWDALMSTAGLTLWLGADPEAAMEQGDQFETSEGVIARVISVKPGEMIRLEWQSSLLGYPSVLQVRVNGEHATSTLGFHQELLRSAEDREAMRQHWTEVAAKLGALAQFA